MSGPSSGEVTRILSQLHAGDHENVSDRLYPYVYDELRRLAGSYMARERQDHTLQATALVHEAYLKLIASEDRTWANRAHFIGVAARVMRHILLDHARARRAEKRGGAQQVLSLDERLVSVSDEQCDALIALDEALAKLGAIDPRQSRVIELRYFGGLSVEETAEVLNVSPKTVKRDWALARAWLHKQVTR